jgi:cytochrome b561
MSSSRERGIPRTGHANLPIRLTPVFASNSCEVSGMKWRNTASRYGYVATALHWVIVAGVVAQYFLAEAAEDHEGARASAFSAAGLHNSIGVTILALAVLRVLWRVVELPPALPQTMKRYERMLARLTHFAFYALLFALPLTGWALATADQQGLSFFGLFDLPQLRLGAQLPIEGGTLTEDQLEEIHEVLFNVLLGLAALHIGAALKHHFFDRDNVLRTMLPWG